jgi:beta-barrel assembly-enhancing protease
MSYYGYGYGYGRAPGFHLRHIIGIAVILFGIFSYFSHETINPVTGEKQHVSMTADQEIALGLQSAPQMIGEMGGEIAPPDPKAQAVQHVGETIASQREPRESGYPFQYHLLADEQTINAFALPGGQIFITRGLYDKLQDEAELAGILGHETGHVVERHVAQQIEQSRLGKSIVWGSAIYASGNHNGLSTWAIADIADQMIQLRFSRKDESQADQCGLQYMTEAGYDPRAMIDVMNILKNLGADSEPEFLETHPDPGNRIEAIQDWMQEHPFLAQQLTRGDQLPH